MIVRTLTLAGGLAGAAGLSQFPEFSQQYAQRLAGAVDELGRVVAEFDADASAVGASREEALVQLAQGGAIGAERAETMAATITRHARLSADLEALKTAGPFTRASQATRFTDTDIAARAWADYKPAVPFTFEGAVFAGVGFFGGLFALWLLFSVIAFPFRLMRRQGV
ncbi:prolyl-tRNA synthetase [Pseudaestuariivita atlantica]|uniref:Prolyl-tRNA synthetase n=2 Tax=Pseudaestuariivita atlantica TaxID=1317121 RepID=A0A0L1JST3_9RHOB|nr:prolyl-tRNA synthetase [Pseudaestuariivita atlantica]